MIDEARLCTTSPKDADALDRALLEAGDFMRAARIHAVSQDGGAVVASSVVVASVE
jgi:hypothetical protein